MPSYSPNLHLVFYGRMEKRLDRSLSRQKLGICFLIPEHSSQRTPHHMIQSHLVIRNGKSSGLFLRYREVSEEILYSKDRLHGGKGVNSPRFIRNSEGSRTKSSIITKCDYSRLPKQDLIGEGGPYIPIRENLPRQPVLVLRLKERKRHTVLEYL